MNKKLKQLYIVFMLNFFIMIKANNLLNVFKRISGKYDKRNFARFYKKCANLLFLINIFLLKNILAVDKFVNHENR